MRVLASETYEGAAQKFEEDFSGIAEKFEADWQMRDYAKKVKALVLVSKADHCLSDILYRTRTGALDIEIYRADHTAYSKKLDRVVMMKDAPDHSKEDFILLSGTKVREMLGNGIKPPPEFSRPEVAQILIDYYQKKSD